QHPQQQSQSQQQPQQHSHPPQQTQPQPDFQSRSLSYRQLEQPKVQQQQQQQQQQQRQQQQQQQSHPQRPQPPRSHSQQKQQLNLQLMLDSDFGDDSLFAQFQQPFQKPAQKLQPQPQLPLHQQPQPQPQRTLSHTFLGTNTAQQSIPSSSSSSSSLFSSNSSTKTDSDPTPLLPDWSSFTSGNPTTFEPGKKTDSSRRKGTTEQTSSLMNQQDNSKSLDRNIFLEDFFKPSAMTASPSTVPAARPPTRENSNNNSRNLGEASHKSFDPMDFFNPAEYSRQSSTISSSSAPLSSGSTSVSSPATAAASVSAGPTSNTFVSSQSIISPTLPSFPATDYSSYGRNSSARLATQSRRSSSQLTAKPTLPAAGSSNDSKDNSGFASFSGPPIARFGVDSPYQAASLASPSTLFKPIIVSTPANAATQGPEHTSQSTPQSPVLVAPTSTASVPSLATPARFVRKPRPSHTMNQQTPVVPEIPIPSWTSLQTTPGSTQSSSRTGQNSTGSVHDIFQDIHAEHPVMQSRQDDNPTESGAFFTDQLAPKSQLTDAGTIDTHRSTLAHQQQQQRQPQFQHQIQVTEQSKQQRHKQSSPSQDKGHLDNIREQHPHPQKHVHERREHVADPPPLPPPYAPAPIPAAPRPPSSTSWTIDLESQFEPTLPVAVVEAHSNKSASIKHPEVPSEPLPRKEKNSQSSQVDTDQQQQQQHQKKHRQRQQQHSQQKSLSTVPPPIPQKKQHQQKQHVPPPAPPPPPLAPPTPPIPVPIAREVLSRQQEPDLVMSQSSSSSPSPSPSSPSSDIDPNLMTRYPPRPPLILYSDDNITVSSLHLTIHAFYFPLNTPVTIPLLSITEIDILNPNENYAGSSSSSSSGAMSWLKYKNWGVPSISDIWWARDQSRQAPASALANAMSEAKAAVMAGTLTAAAAAMLGASPSTTTNTTATAAATIPKAKDVLQVVVRVEGEWLRKGFGVQQERGATLLKEAWKTVKESELGLRSLRPAEPPLGVANQRMMENTTFEDDEDEDDDDFAGIRIEKTDRGGGRGGGGKGVATSSSSYGGIGAEKRQWMSYHQNNTWTAYPYADDSPQFLSQHHHHHYQRRGGNSSSLPSSLSELGLGGGLAKVKARLDPHHYARYQHRMQQQQQQQDASGNNSKYHLGPDESCGDDPLFIDNDLNIHEGL
ncbi:hypothetical protein BG004_004854, partial [Podila humilis]